MLVLSRTQGREVHIGSDIKVKVLSVKRQTVKLGIEAPEDIGVWRDELASQTDQQPPTGGQAAAGMRIVLVVEDDPGHARLIRKALCRRQGTMVTVAETAQSALDALGAKAADPNQIVQPDLILLDLGLPDRSGLDVLRMIRSVPELRATPVVVLSCHDDEAAMSQCMESGANAFVAKSAGYDDLHGQVRRIGQFWAGDCFARRGSRSASTAASDFDARPDHLDASAPIEADVEHHSAATIRGKRILLADDDAGHVTLIKRALRRANIDCTVDVVNNGAEAIDHLFGLGETGGRRKHAMPDLMLLDLNMPKMNGREVLQVLRSAGGQERKNIPPVVVLTSSDEEADINDSYRLGAQSFVRKPVDHGQFAHAVQQTTRYWLGVNEAHRREPACRRAPR